MNPLRHKERPTRLLFIADATNHQSVKDHKAMPMKSFPFGFGAIVPVGETMNGRVYRCEFWRGGGQANQIFHYKGDGTFARQFGTPSMDGTLANAPGEAQNMSPVSPYKVGSTIYVYTPDEGGRGAHRWQFDVP